MSGSFTRGRALTAALIRGSLLCAAGVAAAWAGMQAPADPVRDFSIPAEPAAVSVPAFAEQAGIQILASKDAIDDRRTHAVYGRYAVSEALARLLAHTGLIVSSNDGHTVTLAAPAERSQPPLRPAAAAASADAPGSEQQAALGVIVVTARRIREDINTVPVAITALSGRQIRRRNIEWVGDLQNFVPSLTAVSSDLREDPTFVIRGMGPTGGFGPAALLGGGGSGVVTYFADVPVSGGGPGLFYDLQNVQVVEGPQGTLFGKNTTGGVILFVPRKPENEFGGSVEVGAGDYRMRTVTAVVNAPIIPDRVLTRFAFQAEQTDGFTIDRGPSYPGKAYDNVDYWAVRESIVLNLTDDLQNYTIFSALHTNDHGPGFVLSAVNPQVLPGLETYLAQQVAAGVRSTSLSAPQIDKRYDYGVINTTKWSITKTLHFKNIFSYQVQKWRNSEDIDGSPFVLDDLITPGTGWHTQLGTYTEEPQFQGRALGDLLEWTAGAYYEDGHNIATQPYLVSVANGNFNILSTSVDGERSRGLYTQETYGLGGLFPSLRPLKLTAGYRYTWDDFSFGIGGYSPDIGNACLTSAGTYPQSNCFFQSTGKSTGTSWTVGLDYQISPQAPLLYVRSSRGYIPGGFNPSLGFTPGGVDLPQFRFAPESAVDVELGIKSGFSLFGAPGHVDADVFHSDFSDIQRVVSETLPGGVQSGFTANASEAQIEGFELQGAMIPVPRLRLELAYSYNHGRYTRIDPAAAPSLVGLPFAYLPANKASLNATYDLPVPDSLGKISVNATYAYQSRYFNAPTVQPLDYITGYGLLNVRLDWTAVLRSPLDLAFFVTNATDKVYRSGQYSNYFTDGRITSFYGPPRMFGANLRYSF